MRPPRNLLGLHEAILAALYVLLMGTAAWLEPGFVALHTQGEIASHAFELAMLALPMTMIIISGGIDLSVGSTMALASVTFGMLHQNGLPVLLSAIAAVVVGTVAGACNGMCITRLRTHPLLVTLATLAAYRGLAEGISRGVPISGFSDSFQRLGSGTFMGQPLPLLIMTASAGLVACLAVRSVWGTWIYAIGGNERAARYCAIPVDATKLGLYIWAGATAGLCAVMFAARRNTAKADVGSGIELEVITAVVLGGTSIFGGKGSIAGTVLGVLLVHELREFVGWRWGHDEIILIAIGATLIGSVLLANLASRPRS